MEVTRHPQQLQQLQQGWYQQMWVLCLSYLLPCTTTLLPCHSTSRRSCQQQQGLWVLCQRCRSLLSRLLQL